MRKFLLLPILALFSVNSAFAAAVSVDPSNGRIDESISIKVHDVEPNALHTIQLKSKVNGDGGFWLSSAEFLSSDMGAIDLAAVSAVNGSYDGIDPMGLFWSLEWRDGNPFSPDFGLIYDLDLFVFDKDGAEVATIKVERQSCFSDPSIKRENFDNSGVHATVFHPSGGKSLPTILVLSGSEGGKRESTACLLASKGFAAVALAYFNYPGLPDHLIEIPLEYFIDSLQQVGTHSAIDLQNLGVTGGSKGGELALLLGASFKQVKAVVAYVPSAVVWNGIDPTGTSPNSSSWTLANTGLPFMTFGAEEIDFTSPPYSLRPGYSAPLADIDSLKLAAIPVENSNAPIMVISGDDDAMWPSATFGDMIVSRLLALNFTYEIKHLRYNNAGHFIASGYMPTTSTQFGPFLMGGTAAGNARAATDSWPRVVEFFREHLK